MAVDVGAARGELSADDHGEPVRKDRAPVSLALAAGAVIVLALGGLVGWLGYGAHNARQAESRHNVFLQTARQGTVNLTTISFTDADAAVTRILDSATDTFHDDFQRRAKPFVDVVRQAQSTSVGTVTDAGVEAETADSAQVLVAVSVKTSTAGAPQQDPRSWRMRLAVQRDGQSAKISNVEFVP